MKRVSKALNRAEGAPLWGRTELGACATGRGTDTLLEAAHHNRGLCFVFSTGLWLNPPVSLTLHYWVGQKVRWFCPIQWLY